ncbi:DoxX family protein [Yoonia sp. SS1-5]|uniref:DoxX family protein n=1 Tax=Yoonia rhodophyticola TaxID=3137370 RepID=A0AAN0NKP1_9RHOB
MNALLSTSHRVAGSLNRAGDAALPLLARFVFAATLVMYFWHSGLTKLGDGIFGFLQPSLGAYAQIFPKAMEAAGFDTAQLTAFHWAVVTGGTIAEFVLPLFIVIGFFTRLSALGMIGFIAIQSLTDLYGHGGIAHEGTLGAWFDRLPDGLILDQRAFWTLCLLVLVFKGAGALSVDRWLLRRPIY